jgi:HK97 family phage major capsid protein
VNIEEIAQRKQRNIVQGKALFSRIEAIQAKGASRADMDAITPEYKAWEAERQSVDAQERAQEFARKMGGDFTPTPAAQPFLPEAAVKSLWQAAKSRQSLRLDSKDFRANADLKAGPFGTGGFTSGALPAALRPDLQLGLPYEPNRIFSSFTQMAAPTAGSVEYVQHASNTNPAAAVAELGLKPDLGPVYTTVTTAFTKVAALASISMEALEDYSHFATWLPQELMRAVYDAENGEVLNGSGSSPHMLGLLNTSGILTRAMSSDTPLDAIRKGINDLRTGTAFAKASLIVVHPTTLADLELQKSSTGQYLLNPDDPSALGDTSRIFGVDVVSTTTLAAGKAVVLDASTVLAWTRHAITLETNQFGGDSSTASYWQSNVVGFRAEERIAIGVTRPTAVCVISGLPS